MFSRQMGNDKGFVVINTALLFYFKTMETMIQAKGSDKEFMNEFESARKERNRLFDSINKNEQHNATRAQDYVNL